MKKILFCVLVFFIVLSSNARGDLTGRWSCNDGGTYYLRQTDQMVYWYGEAARSQPAWSNVFIGRLRQGRIEGSWTDVPKGRTAGGGQLDLVIDDSGNRLRAVTKTGGFSGSRWVRLAAPRSSDRPLKPLWPSTGEDCVKFDPASVDVSRVAGRWKIVDLEHWLFDFGSDQTAAKTALAVIRYYRLNRSCFIGRRDRSFSYMLAQGGSPSGAMTGEDCLAFDPHRLTVANIGGSWKIGSSRQWLFDCGKSETRARQVLAVIKQHGFTHSCVVGRPNPDFTYLRR
jgi:hypothetical protein